MVFVESASPVCAVERLTPVAVSGTAEMTSAPSGAARRIRNSPTSARFIETPLLYAGQARPGGDLDRIKGPRRYRRQAFPAREVPRDLLKRGDPVHEAPLLGSRRREHLALAILPMDRCRRDSASLGDV